MNRKRNKDCWARMWRAGAACLTVGFLNGCLLEKSTVALDLAQPADFSVRDISSNIDLSTFCGSDGVWIDAQNQCNYKFYTAYIANCKTELISLYTGQLFTQTCSCNCNNTNTSVTINVGAACMGAANLITSSTGCTTLNPSNSQNVAYGNTLAPCLNTATTTGWASSANPLRYCLLSNQEHRNSSAQQCVIVAGSTCPQSYPNGASAYLPPTTVPSGDNCSCCNSMDFAGGPVTVYGSTNCSLTGGTASPPPAPSCLQLGTGSAAAAAMLNPAYCPASYTKALPGPLNPTSGIPQMICCNQ